MDLNKPKVEEAKPTRKEILSFNPDRLATLETKEGAKAKEAAAVEKIDPNKLIEPKTRTETEYRDENGTLYRVGKELLPNVEYHLDGYDYRTDSKGRIVHAGGQLKLSGETRQPMKAKFTTLAGATRRAMTKWAISRATVLAEVPISRILLPWMPRSTRSPIRGLRIYVPKPLKRGM